MIMRQFKILIGDTDKPFEIRVPAIGVEAYLAPVKLTSLDGNDFAFDIEVEVAQSGTAGYTAQLINVTETSTGSGTKLLADWRVDGVSVASIDNEGVFTGDGSGLTNLPVGTGDLRADGTVPLTANWDMGGFGLSNTGDIIATGDVIIAEGADTQFRLTHSTGFPRIQFDSLEYLQFHQASRTFDFVIRGDSRFSVDLLGINVPRDIVMTERADHGHTPAAGFGYLWTKDTTPSTLIFTNDAGTDHDLTAVQQTTGTFTPTVLDTTLDDSEGQTYTNQEGYYIKTGKLVHFNLRLGVSSFGTLTTSDQARIGGLPFTSEATSTNASNCIVGHFVQAGSTVKNSVQAVVWNNDAHVTLFETAQDLPSRNNLLLSEWGVGEIDISGSYWTD